MRLPRTRFRRLIGGTCLLSGAAYAYDTKYKYQRFHRNVRSLVAACFTVYDYKFAWQKCQTPEDESAIHDRVAKRWFDVCSTNGGLYIKIGQAVTTMQHIMPPEFSFYFKQLHDQAPQMDPEMVRTVFAEEFGQEPSEIFKEWEEKAVASASIAQVHKATLNDGTVVAVKVQKPWIAVQMPWDLFCYRTLVWCLDYFFELPMYWTTEEACRSIRAEVDFIAEATHAEKAAEHWRQSKLADSVYVPKVFWALTSKRVLVQEFVTGLKINELQKLRAARFDSKAIAETMIGVFADQIFRSGFVHGDPHPGNLFVRWSPGPSPRRMQLVVLDHGMYTECSEAFRNSYCRLWKAMVLGDTQEMVDVSESWGVGDSDLFASFQLMKPYSKNKSAALKNTTKGDMLEHAQMMRNNGYELAKRLLKDSQKTPTELVVVGRHMNIVRANNAAMGARANRVNIMARTAASNVRRGGRFGGIIDTSYWAFRLRLWLIATAHQLVQIRKKVVTFCGGQAYNFEELMQHQMEAQMEKSLGIKLKMQDGENWESISG